MPSKVEITIPSYQTDRLVAEIKQLHELVGLRVQREFSLQPPGDLIPIEVTNRPVNPLPIPLKMIG